ncbi:AraC family transcriptional regulator [Oscillospiraceae bacterium HV4-5-C5C]|nr:AraC family transcriptional regulator [Oscillospiraceae bacterium HV4-5-C5C]
MLHEIFADADSGRQAISMTIYQTGREQCRPRHCYGPAVRLHFLIHFVLSGAGTFCQDGLNYFLQAGDAFLICPHKVTVYEADARDPWDYAWIEFDGLKARDYLKQAGLSAQNPLWHDRQALQPGHAASTLLALQKQAHSRETRQLGLLYLLLDQLAQHADLAEPVKALTAQEQYVDQAIRLIQNNYHSQITVEELACQLNLNRSYFSKLFRRVTGRSPQAYLLQVRMQVASQLLLDPALPVQTVATSVGYHNPLSFSRAFLKYCGLTPSGARQQAAAGLKADNGPIPDGD